LAAFGEILEIDNNFKWLSMSRKSILLRGEEIEKNVHNISQTSEDER